MVVVGCTIGILAVTFGKWFKLYFFMLSNPTYFFFLSNLSITFRFLPPFSTPPLKFFFFFIFTTYFPSISNMKLTRCLQSIESSVIALWILLRIVTVHSYINRLFHLVKVVWREYQSFLGYFVYVFVGSIWRLSWSVG